MGTSLRMGLQRALVVHRCRCHPLPAHGGACLGRQGRSSHARPMATRRRRLPRFSTSPDRLELAARAHPAGAQGALCRQCRHHLLGRHRPHDALHPAAAATPPMTGSIPTTIRSMRLIASARRHRSRRSRCAAARAELYFSAFFVAYAADLKIGRVIPQKVDPRLFRNRKTIDVAAHPDRPEQASRAEQVSRRPSSRRTRNTRR